MNTASFDIESAKRYGVKCAVLLEFINSSGGTIKMGLYEISKALPFLTFVQVRHGMKKLVAKNVLRVYKTNPITYILNDISK